MVSAFFAFASVLAADPPAALTGNGVFLAPGWRIETARADALTLDAVVPGGPGGREPTPLWTLNFHHGPHVTGHPRRTTRRFRRLFTLRDEAQGSVYELCHMADRRENEDVGCWVARCLQASGTGVRVRLWNRNGLLTAGAENLTGGDSMGLSLRLAPGTAGDRYRVGDEDFTFPVPPPEPGRREDSRHAVTPGTRLVVGEEAGAVFTLWLGVRGSLSIVTLAGQDRVASRVIEFSTGEPRLDLWWAPGDAAPPAPEAAADGWLADAMRLTLAGPAPDRVRVVRRTIDGLIRLAESTPGALDEPDLRTRRQAFDAEVHAFEALLAREAQPGDAGSLDDWIAIASLTARIEETRKSIEPRLVMKLIP